MIKFENMNISLGDFSLKDINLDINNGEYFVILGPSGAGKTILLELLAGLIEPDKGTVTGISRNKTALIYQDYMLFPHMNVSENIAYGLKVRKTPKDEIEQTVKTAAEKLDVADLLERDTINLSGGEKQRVAIARASVIDPDVYLLDEPTAALDVNTRSKILKTFSEIHRSKKSTFVHVTHNFEEAFCLADKIAVINNGEIIQIGTPKEIFDHPNTKFVADFVGFENTVKGSIKNSVFIPENDKNTSIFVSAEDQENIHIAFKADEVILSTEKIESSARNSMQGNISEINQKLSQYVITVKVNDTEITSVITKDSFEEMNLKINDEVFVTFKSSAVRIFPY